MPFVFGVLETAMGGVEGIPMFPCRIAAAGEVPGGATKRLG